MSSNFFKVVLNYILKYPSVIFNVQGDMIDALICHAAALLNNEDFARPCRLTEKAYIPLLFRCFTTATHVGHASWKVGAWAITNAITNAVINAIINAITNALTRYHKIVGLKLRVHSQDEYSILTILNCWIRGSEDSGDSEDHRIRGYQRIRF